MFTHSYMTKRVISLLLKWWRCLFGDLYQQQTCYSEKPPMHLQIASNSPITQPRPSRVFPNLVVMTHVRSKKLCHAHMKTSVVNHMLTKFPQSQMANITAPNQTSKSCTVSQILPLFRGKMTQCVSHEREHALSLQVNGQMVSSVHLTKTKSKPLGCYGVGTGTIHFGCWLTNLALL